MSEKPMSLDQVAAEARARMSDPQKVERLTEDLRWIASIAHATQTRNTQAGLLAGLIAIQKRAESALVSTAP